MAEGSNKETAETRREAREASQKLIAASTREFFGRRRKKKENLEMEKASTSPAKRKNRDRTLERMGKRKISKAEFAKAQRKHRPEEGIEIPVE